MANSDSRPLYGKAVLASGAAAGIGLAPATKLTELGADVLAADLTSEAPFGVPYAADLSTRDGNKDVVDATIRAFGRLDCIIANARVQHASPIADLR